MAGHQNGYNSGWQFSLRKALAGYRVTILVIVQQLERPAVFVVEDSQTVTWIALPSLVTTAYEVRFGVFVRLRRHLKSGYWL